MATVPPADRPMAPRLKSGLRFPVHILDKTEFTLKVVDESHRPVKGAEVIVEPDKRCGSVEVDAGKTNEMGEVKATWTMGTRAGVCTAKTRVKGVDRMPGVISVIALSGPPGKIVVLRGEGQSAKYGEQLPLPVIVRVLDRYGNVVRNASVRFEISSGGGRVVDVNAVPRLVRHTNIGGIASANWRLGPTGDQVLTIRALKGAAVPVQIRATAEK
jgi:hypothetical protein